MKRVVLVESENVLRMTFRAGLEGAGFEVKETDNGQDGVLLVRENYPCIFIACLSSAGRRTARERNAIQELRSEFPDLPIISLSGDMYDGAAASARNWNVDLHLTKPVRLPELLRAVNQVVSARRE